MASTPSSIEDISNTRVPLMDVVCTLGTDSAGLPWNQAKVPSPVQFKVRTVLIPLLVMLYKTMVGSLGVTVAHGNNGSSKGRQCDIIGSVMYTVDPLLRDHPDQRLPLLRGHYT